MRVKHPGPARKMTSAYFSCFSALFFERMEIHQRTLDKRNSKMTLPINSSMSVSSATLDIFIKLSGQSAGLTGWKRLAGYGGKYFFIVFYTLYSFFAFFKAAER
jgi:hypothetical protein